MNLLETDFVLGHWQRLCISRPFYDTECMDKITGRPKECCQIRHPSNVKPQKSILELINVTQFHAQQNLKGNTNCSIVVLNFILLADEKCRLQLNLNCNINIGGQCFLKGPEGLYVNKLHWL